MWEKMMKYFGKNAAYNSAIHFIGGIGAGIILARPIAVDHPVRWGAALIAVSLLGYAYPLMFKK